MTRASLCPCGTGAAYASCCRPLHRGEREADSAEALMRSRYAAFALREVDYLWRTLHDDHEDRARPRELVIAGLRAAASANRYMGLRVLDRDGPDADGITGVLFVARVFERGRDKSFVEASRFAHDGKGFRYLSGDARGCAGDHHAASRLTLRDF